MNKLKNSGDTLKTNSSWDALKDVKFAGESGNKQKANYNEKYINDFGRDKLREMLGDKEALKTIGDDYLDQYRPNSQSKATNLAKKESLDHFVLERLSSEHPEMFLESQEFKNYAEYIINTANNKHFNSTDNRYTVYPEFITNPVLRNKKARDLVLKVAIPNGNPEKLDAWVKQNREWYKEEVLGSAKKMEERKQIGQRDFEIVGDYLYSSKRFDTGTAKTFAEYCFNNIKPDYNLKPTTPILGALTNYFASQYTIDDGVKKNSRFFISDSEAEEHGIGVSKPFGCVLQQSYFTKISMTTDSSMYKSRTNLDKNNDIYRLMMISFHELTHDHQKNMVRKGDKSSSSMMYILREVLKKGSGCYPTKNGKKRGYYNENHDSDETEIQADEEAWRQCRTFLAVHQRDYSKDEKQDKINSKRWAQCFKNEREVSSRRSFTKKLANTGNEYNAIKYDIETLQKTIEESPSLLKTFPQLTDYVYTSGNLRPDTFITTELAKDEHVGLDYRQDVFGTEIGTYMLTEDNEVKKLLNFVGTNGKNFTPDQTKTLIYNLHRVVHQTVDRSRDLNGVDFSNLDETKAHGKDFDMTELKTSILKQYLTQVYNSISTAEIAKKQHPELSDTIDTIESISAGIGSYYHQLSVGTNLNPKFVKRTIQKYESTGHPVLVGMAKQLRNDYNM